MTATDELRRLLDERGVEHVDYGGRGHEDEAGRPATWWSGEHGECAAVQRDDDRLLTVEVFLTPEQAVKATLGRGTCQEVKIDRYWRGCGECGYIWEFMYGIGKCERPRYCPSCGRKAVDA